MNLLLMQEGRLGQMQSLLPSSIVTSTSASSLTDCVVLLEPPLGCHLLVLGQEVSRLAVSERIVEARSPA